MQRGFRIEPGSAARSAEQEKKAQGPMPTFRIGSAAKSAEERARAERAEEAGREPFRPSVGVRMSVGTGAKFELPTRPTGPGEALPVNIAAQAPAPPAPHTPPASVPVQPQKEPQAQGLSRLFGKFRGLFGRNK